MENIHKPVIVPWDFTQVAEFAFAHAVNVCENLKRDIILLHIVEKEEAMEPSAKKLETLIEDFSLDTKVKIHPLVKLGTIFETIRAVAHETRAEMVIMGTHGRKGMQKFMGSWALKVMAHSKVPFLVVQKKPGNDNFDKIVIPVDFRSENKEKVNWMHYLSNNYKSKFLIFRRKVRDRGFKRKIASNIHYVESFLKNNDVEYEIHRSSGRGSFVKETVEFAKQQGADMILILVTRDIGFLDYIVAAPEQYVISNPEKIPVMSINPKPAKIASGFRAGGG